MKKISLLCTLAAVSMLYAEPQEVDSVVNITPDQSQPDQSYDAQENKQLVLPKPPEPMHAADVNTLDLKTSTTPTKKHMQGAQAAAPKDRKALAQMSHEEQMNYLKRKIDKLREKSHKTRARIHALEIQVTRLEQEVKDLKEGHNHTKGE